MIKYIYLYLSVAITVVSKVMVYTSVFTDAENGSSGSYLHHYPFRTTDVSDIQPFFDLLLKRIFGMFGKSK
jgi:hypothetical protein